MTSEIIDQASALEEMMRDHAIQAHRLNHSAASATHCVDCCEEIPELRRVKFLAASDARRANRTKNYA